MSILTSVIMLYLVVRHLCCAFIIYMLFLLSLSLELVGRYLLSIAYYANYNKISHCWFWSCEEQVLEFRDWIEHLTFRVSDLPLFCLSSLCFTFRGNFLYIYICNALYFYFYYKPDYGRSWRLLHGYIFLHFPSSILIMFPLCFIPRDNPLLLVLSCEVRLT